MSLQAYQRTAARTEAPREAEYRLFSQVTRALMEAAVLPEHDIGGRIDALDWNRRMWTALATDCSQPGNALPAPLRASFISLSLWVGRHTSAVMRREEEIQPLVEINRMVMQGLSGRPDGQQAAA